MPNSHNKRPDSPQPKKPTKRTDRPTRTGSSGEARRTAAASHIQRDRSNKPAHAREQRGRVVAAPKRTAPTAAPKQPSQHNTNEDWQRLAGANIYSAQRTPGASNMVVHRSRMKILLIILLVAIIAVAVVFAVSSCSSSSSNEPESNAMPPASDRAADAAQTITLSFAGDCTLGTDANFDRSTSFVAKYDAVDDPSYFFANVADIFTNDDATIVNMEGTLTDSTTRADKTFAFKAPAEYAQILAQGNVEAASLANNHSHDYGERSYTDTIEAVEAAGVPTFGYDRIAYLDVKGVKVALVGTYELAEGLGVKDQMVSNINTAKEAGAQIIVVYFHWGTERETVPDSVQMELGHAAIDAGATLVVGSHPHVIQGIEDYNGHQIVYSLGNFCFGGNKNPSDKDCMIFQQTFTVQGDNVRVDGSNVIPCSISSVSSSNNYQPTPATGDEKERIEAKIQRSNDAIAEMAAANS